MRWLIGLAALAALTGCGETTASQPAPQPSTNPAVAYASVIGPLSTKLGESLTTAGKSCSAPDQTCIDAEKAALADVEAFKKAIDSSSPPACMQETNTLVRDGLTLMSAGITKEIQGIQAQDATTMNEGSSDVTSGNDKVTQASTALKASKC